MAKDPTVRREMDASPDDDLVIKRALNRSYLASTYNKPNASPEELDQIMRAHSITHWGIDDPAATEGSQQFASLGALVSRAANGGMDRSDGMAWGPDGNLYYLVRGGG